MTYHFPTATYPETPKGKRSIHHNIYGNTVGYVAGKRFWEFGVTDAWNKSVANNWLAGESLDLAQRGTIQP